LEFSIQDLILFGDKRINVFEGPKQDRHMTTGLHTVRDIHCITCQLPIGWKYVFFYFKYLIFFKTKTNANYEQEKAFESSQKYKEGKFILERELIAEVHL
jgi:hypothetical protein